MIFIYFRIVGLIKATQYVPNKLSHTVISEGKFNRMFDSYPSFEILLDGICSISYLTYG